MFSWIESKWKGSTPPHWLNLKIYLQYKERTGFCRISGLAESQIPDIWCGRTVTGYPATFFTYRYRSKLFLAKNKFLFFFSQTRILFSIIKTELYILLLPGLSGNRISGLPNPESYRILDTKKTGVGSLFRWKLGFNEVKKV